MKHFFEGIAPLMNWYLHTWHLLFLNTKPSFVYALTQIACEVNDCAQSMTKYNLSFINQTLFLIFRSDDVNDKRQRILYIYTEDM